MTLKQVEDENIWNVIDIMKKMSPGQHLIASSTSAVSEGTFLANESTLVNTSCLDVYSLSMWKREIRLKECADRDYDHHLPRISLLRFGTVIGNSPAQRTDLMVPSFFLSAYTSGVLNVRGHDKMRSFLSLQDLGGAIYALISSPISLPYGIWNLASFDATTFKIASTVASLTGAQIDSDEPYYTPLLSSTEGFSLDCSSFRNNFHFTFFGSLSSTLSEFDRDVPASITSKGPHAVASADQSDVMPCPVCGSKGQQMVIDLGPQPLANDFTNNVDDALAKPRFPLKLVRCRV
jgi:nucleoside-diphosphate-sugar epimerase